MDQFHLLFGAQPTTASPFPPDSRYAGLPTAEHVLADGRKVRYVVRRFLPDWRDLALLAEHRVAAGERLDLLAAAYLGNPELFWRIADGNDCVDPGELTVAPGRVLRITLNQGLPAQPGGVGG
jgi:hypothetical protein